MNLKKILILCLVVVMSMSVLTACSKPAEKEEAPATNEDAPKEEAKEDVELIISAAASLTDVLEELKVTYEEENPNIKLNFTFGSSGALQAQIEEGAPVDVFFSAAEKQMDALVEGDHILEDTRNTVLINKVVLIAPKDSTLDIKSFEDLANDNIGKIAIGDPSNVPVGQYTEEIFENLKLTDSAMPKAVLGSDVRTVLTWVESGEVDCGIVYATDAFTSKDINIVADAPEGSHKKVTYPLAVVKDSKHAEEAKSFIDFLMGEEAGKAFESYGFDLSK